VPSALPSRERGARSGFNIQLLRFQSGPLSDPLKRQNPMSPGKNSMEHRAGSAECKARSRQRRESPISRELGDGAFCVFYLGPSCLTPPDSQRGLRAKNCERRITKRPEKSKLKKNTGDRSQKTGERRITSGILECWKDGGRSRLS